MDIETPSATDVLVVGAVLETAARERRVALVPDVVAALVKAGRRVLLESGAGGAANFPDGLYRAAGATVTTRQEVLRRSDVVAVVRPPDEALGEALHAGQLLIGLVDPLAHTDLVGDLAARGVTVAAFELVPRTLSRAQAMDALSSQASAAGYRAGIVAAAAFGRYLPMMVTAAGTARPAAVLVIGAGVAGLQAIGTLNRLGAVVTGYDVRPASRGEVESLGARFLTSPVITAQGTGGYARALTADEAVQQQADLARRLTAFDIVITTAKVPGRTPPLLVTAASLATLAPGSVCVDLAAGEQRGNVAGSADGQRFTTDNGVVVVGAGNLASELPTSASGMYARNVAALLASLAPGGAVAFDPLDELHAAVVVCHGGRLTHPPGAASGAASGAAQIRADVS